MIEINFIFHYENHIMFEFMNIEVISFSNIMVKFLKLLKSTDMNKVNIGTIYCYLYILVNVS